MGLFDILKKKKPIQQEERSYTPYGLNSLVYNSNSSYNNNKAMLLSTVYRCVDVIGDSVAQLPLEPYFIDKDGYKRKFTEHPSYYLLNREPNRKMSRFTFMKTLITSVLLDGNGYAYIERDDKGDAVALKLIPSNSVTVSNVNDNIMYNVAGFKQLVEPINMIHILNFSYDGITGISTLQHAKNTLGLATDSEAHAEGFFKGGANLAGIIKVQTSLTPKQKQDIREVWQSTFSPITGTPNGIAVLEGNMDFQPITVNPSDAQLLETRQFNVIDICRFFGVSPVKAFDLSKSSYSTVEATQLAFLTDTLAPLLEKIELEFERKLYKPSERNNIDVRFDTSVLLRADKASLANYYNTLFQIGVITPNEIRKALDLEAIENGDHTFVQVNIQTLNNAVKDKVDIDPLNGNSNDTESI
ncbi:phage portal protein [Parabacteroides gordonii]|uniref:phage portal protein n=1 Tax=Parabacteroides gordonii TaxID=574930 RepID=UPI0026F11D82|nr:phage portal protein [Parabacteroides gordonii]